MATTGDQGGTGPTVRRMVLGGQLRRLREAAGITRADAGYQIRSSESKISRLELGRVGFKERDVADLLTMYGVTDPDERDVFLGMVKQSNTPGWWNRYNDLMPSWFQDYVGLEESASRIQSYELQYVPGLLQTEDYAIAVASEGRADKVNDDVRRRVSLRMGRQKILVGPSAPKIWAVLDASVLYRPLGGAEVMKTQIDRLIELTKLPNISLQILPWEFSGCSAEGAFTLLRFAEPELPNIVYIEHLSGALYLEKQDELELYSRVFDQLMVDSMTPTKTREELLRARERF
ncbi:XRE family transcriptional regulator [Pseudonocardiaceae bacterium YIM PH 21723]|nr:XRE family transcriptional regulator [Pseudonocardiaceae bacterium YIM PH 21723]